MYKALAEYIHANPKLHGVILIGALALLGFVSLNLIGTPGPPTATTMARVVGNEAVKGGADVGYTDQYYPRVRFKPSGGREREVVIKTPKSLRYEPWEVGMEVEVRYGRHDENVAFLASDDDVTWLEGLAEPVRKDPGPRKPTVRPQLPRTPNPFPKPRPRGPTP